MATNGYIYKSNRTTTIPSAFAALKAFCEEVYIDSGTYPIEDNRPELDKLISLSSEGDEIVFYQDSDLLGVFSKTVEELNRKKIQYKFLNTGLTHNDERFSVGSEYLSIMKEMDLMNLRGRDSFAQSFKFVKSRMSEQEQRELFNYREQGMSYSEISRKLNWSVKALNNAYERMTGK